jgi:TRAP-type C4-dicarboxylate transport system permease small subunit
MRAQGADMIALDKISRFLNLVFLWIAGCFLTAMIVITCANIFFRIVWMPVRGTFELMGYFGAIVTAFALGYTQRKKGHIAVDIVVMRFSETTQRILNGLNSLICLAFFGIAGWQIAKHAGTLCRSGEVTETLQIAYYPFTYGVSIGCFVLAMVLLVDFLKYVLGDTEIKESHK